MIMRGNILMNWDTGFYAFLNMDVISEQSLTIYDLGLEIRKNEEYHYENASRDYQGFLFQYTLDGYGYYETNETSYKITKDKAFLITFPENSNYYLPNIKNHYWTFFYIHFYGPAAMPFYKRIRELTGPIMELRQDSPPIRMFFELYETLKDNKSLERYAKSEWVYQFLTSLLRYVESPPNKIINPYVTAAIDWMHLYYSKQCNLEEMSNTIGFSYPHLTRVFYKEMGINPIQYLINIRLEHGMYLLINTDTPIQEIAQQCGFSCANYFTKVYKKIFHTTPTEYRKQHGKK